MEKAARKTLKLFLDSTSKDATKSAKKPCLARSTSAPEQTSSGESLSADVEDLQRKTVDGVLEIADAATIPREAFEITRIPTRETVQTQANTGFAFRHNARKSLALDSGHTDAQSTSLDVYTKSTDASMLLWLLVVGTKDTAFEVAGAMKHCGVLVGIVTLLFVGALQTVVVRNLLDVPHLVGRNLESYGDAAYVCFTRPWYLLSVYVNLAGWALHCNTCFFQLLYHYPFWKSGDWDQSHWIISIMFSLCLLAMLTCFWKNLRLSNLKRFGRLCVISALLSVILIALSGAWRAWAVWETKEKPIYRLFTSGSTTRTTSTTKTTNTTNTNGGVLYNYGQGCTAIMLAYSGQSIVPYLAADSLNPQHAKEVVTRGMGILTLFFVIAGLTGYVGYGDGTNFNFMYTLYQEDKRHHRLGEWCTRNVIDAVIFVGAPGRFVIFFWALIRELHNFLALHALPPMQLKLPWAIRRYHAIRGSIRVSAILLTTIGMCAIVLRYSRKPSLNSLMFAQRPLVVLTQMVLMPWMYAVALKSHNRRGSVEDGQLATDMKGKLLESKERSSTRNSQNCRPIQIADRKEDATHVASEADDIFPWSKTFHFAACVCASGLLLTGFSFYEIYSQLEKALQQRNNKGS